jgi:FkbM family methyltransferase
LREEGWRWVRGRAAARRLYALPLLNKTIRALVEGSIPSSTRHELRVRGGLGAGLVFELNPRWELAMWDGDYEAEVQRTLQQGVAAGTVFYDVGAGIGYYACIAARLGASVIAFEPDASNAECLERHAHLNGLQHQVEIVRAAVFSHSGRIGLEPAEQKTAHGNAHVIGDGRTTRASVPCVTIDEVARSKGPPDFIKIDVEGAESDVLRGAEAVFAHVKPRLLCEVHDALNHEFVERWLAARGYAAAWLEDDPTYPRHLLAGPVDVANSD